MKALTLATTALLLGAGCGTTHEGESDGGIECRSGDEAAVLAGSTQVDYATHTDISISLGAPPCEGPMTSLSLPVAMTNHTCSIPGYEGFETKVALETSDGLSRADARWEVSSTDPHHPAGALVFETGGRPLVGCDTQWLAIVITELDLAEGEHLRFEWSGEVLDPLRVCPDG